MSGGPAIEALQSRSRRLADEVETGVLELLRLAAEIEEEHPLVVDPQSGDLLDPPYPGSLAMAAACLACDLGAPLYGLLWGLATARPERPWGERLDLEHLRQRWAKEPPHEQ